MPKGRRAAPGSNLTRYIMVCACGYREGPWTGRDIIWTRADLHLKAGFCLTSGPVEVFRAKLVEKIEGE